MKSLALLFGTFLPAGCATVPEIIEDLINTAKEFSFKTDELIFVEHQK